MLPARLAHPRIAFSSPLTIPLLGNLARQFSTSRAHSMRYKIKVLATDTVDASPSVLIAFDSRRYLFNCGEGTQRFCHEHKVGIRKVEQIFLTRVAWQYVGGLPGMLLTLADAGASSIALNGPGNLSHFMASTRHFIYRESLDLTITEHRPEEEAPFQDENLTVTPVHLCPDMPPATNCRKRKSDSDLEVAHANKKTVLDRMFPGSRGQHPLADASSEPNAPHQAVAGMSIPAGSSEDAVITTATAEPSGVLKRSEIGRLNAAPLPISTPDPTVLAYICRGPAVPGKFDPKAAIALGLKPGPDFGKLQRGESVTAPDGTVVSHEQVVGSERPGAIFIVIECPSLAYVSAIIAASQFKPLFAAKDPVRCIVHIVADGVLEDARYRDWMNKFSSKTHHLVVGKRYNSADICFRAAADFQVEVNALDKDIFPLPYYSDSPQLAIKSVPQLPKLTVAAKALTDFTIEPAPKLETTECLAPYVAKLEPIESRATIVQEAQAMIAQAALTRRDSDIHPAEDGVVVIPLGTGSAIPGRFRNVSSTFVTFPTGNLLLDAGEGTLGQLFRHYGPEALRKEVANLKLVFVSHLHADHHLGIIRMLSFWNEVRDKEAKPLVMIAPARYRIFLKEYSDVEDFGFNHILFIDCEEVRWKKDETLTTVDGVSSTADNGTDNERLAVLKESMQLESVAAVLVDHCPWAYALVLQTRAGCKLVFSGDCRPSENLIEAGKGATIVIHEGTLCDSMKDEADRKRHCTIGQAIQVAEKMQARNLLLTHFSQRYPKMPPLPAALTDLESTRSSSSTLQVGIAYDLMRVPLSDFWRLPILLRMGLARMFPADVASGADENEPDMGPL
ncbi:Zinc phosphodiesterase ELAC protein 2 [Geranomyces variabilis]|uniref:ribonuclease Z n=1 Tax=Geranomyces variabilis TaxID=109894 RepID=A0AAD5XV40_9FUNG|nr:Zinc phosphodiesterase ELAC protein 2 [Geranomyces variabilis]